MQSESELLQRIKSFDQNALAEVYDRYSPGLYRYAMRLLGDQNLAEDYVSETFTRLLQELEANRGPRNYLQAYLYRMIHNLIVDHYRTDHRTSVELKETLQDHQANVEENAQLHQWQDKLRATLQCLTPDQLQVVMLKYFEGWDFIEIARALQKPVGAIKALQHRAIVTLRRNLQEEHLL